MDKDKITGFAEKVYADMAGAMTMGMAYLGAREGLFAAMAGKGPMRPAEVVAATGLQARYVEEWLSGMTAAGYLDYDPEAGTFLAPDEHSYLLASEGSDHYMGGLFYAAPALLSVAPKVAEAFRKGGGVRFDGFGPDWVTALDLMNGGQYEKRLASYWLPMLPETPARLAAGGRALDVGCGVGRVCFALAEAFPAAEVVGLDPDHDSIARARAAAGPEMAERVRFVEATTRDFDGGGGFDLITLFDCLHDFAAPERTLEEIRGLLKPGGAVLIMEPRAADRLEDNVNDLGAVYYGFSLLHCMTQSLAEGGPGLGTCLGPKRIRALLLGAGFSRCDQLPIKSVTNLFHAAYA